MKTSALTTTAAALGIFTQVAFAQPSQQECLQKLANDTTAYANALTEEFHKKAQTNGSWFERAGVGFMTAGISLACKSLSANFSDIKVCLNETGEVESRYMSERTSYWTNLRERYVALRDRNICLK